MNRWRFEIVGEVRPDMALRVLNLFLVAGVKYETAVINRSGDRSLLVIITVDTDERDREIRVERCRSMVMVHAVNDQRRRSARCFRSTSTTPPKPFAMAVFRLG